MPRHNLFLKSIQTYSCMINDIFGHTLLLDSLNIPKFSDFVYFFDGGQN